MCDAAACRLRLVSVEIPTKQRREQLQAASTSSRSTRAGARSIIAFALAAWDRTPATACNLAAGIVPAADDDIYRDNEGPRREKVGQPMGRIVIPDARPGDAVAAGSSMGTMPGSEWRATAADVRPGWSAGRR